MSVSLINCIKEYRTKFDENAYASVSLQLPMEPLDIFIHFSIVIIHGEIGEIFIGIGEGRKKYEQRFTHSILMILSCPIHFLPNVPFFVFALVEQRASLLT